MRRIFVIGQMEVDYTSLFIAAGELKFGNDRLGMWAKILASFHSLGVLTVGKLVAPGLQCNIALDVNSVLLKA